MVTAVIGMYRSGGIIKTDTHVHSYYVQLERYHNELNITRQYANQKVWPRAVLVRRAR